MPTRDQAKEFYILIDEGVSRERAAAMVGLSKRWGARHAPPRVKNDPRPCRVCGKPLVKTKTRNGRLYTFADPDAKFCSRECWRVSIRTNQASERESGNGAPALPPMNVPERDVSVPVR